RRDYELLRTIESRYFHLFYTLGEEVEAAEHTTDLEPILKHLDPNKKFLVVTDSEMFTYQFGEKKESNGMDIFDGAVYAKCDKCKAVDRYRSLYRVMHNLRSGGLFIALPESYEKLRSGSVIMDFLMEISGVRLMLPFYDSAGAMIGQKK
ncbi:MAG: hypothetical protein IJT54_04280, partial [Candidatus Methanomethylophilaceae archaeon]|nr:hypothetical protein [Candidatus Methanomethylophilaceae archaeon]